MNRTTERRLIKLETGSSWWREKYAAGTLAQHDLVLMTDQDLLDFIAMKHPDPEAFIKQQFEAAGREYIGPDDRARQRGGKAGRVNGRANGHNGATYAH
jgi:hypothetical protein